MHTDPVRYRQFLLEALTDDGLEELTLRIVRPDYPHAHRAGKGRDGGIDVLSDFELPPARAWQCKNHKTIDWDDCRDSLRTAMNDEHPPPHYTFVFPRPLSGPQRDFWRKTFLPEQRELYPGLGTLDFCDNVAERLDDHPELIDKLSNGALASSYRDVATAASRTGVNPLASIPDLIGDAPELARRAVETGRTDPRYRYENRQREARADDRTIPEGRVRFGFEAPIGRPREFTATIRTGEAVQEKAAEPREEVPLDQVTLWFSGTSAGAAHRQHVRDELAAGRPVNLIGDANVGLDAHPLPDRFAQLADSDGILRSGDIHVGLSDPLTLEVWMETKEGDTPTAAIALYRIPSEPGSSTSYGGTFRGALVFIDINPDAERPDGEAGKWADTSIAVGIDADGVPATELVTGLGFALAFGRADRLHLSCDGVLPTDGMHLDITDHGLDGETAKILEHAVIVTTTLAQLTSLDGRPRSTGSEHDVAIAELVLDLLHHHEIRDPLTAPYRYSIPDDVLGDDPAKLMRGVRLPLGTLAGQPTVIAELRIDGDADGRLIEMDGKTIFVATPREGARAEIVMALVGPIP
jgi:hypothetical protein